MCSSEPVSLRPTKPNISATRAWVLALRLRTLPLGVSGVALACLLSWGGGFFSWSISLLCLSTALLLQIVANLANDYGDCVNHMDTSERRGPLRMSASGLIKVKSMAMAVVISSVLTVLSGLALLFTVLQIHPDLALSFWIVLGATAILAAIAYTVGAKPYGYRGGGDLAVLVFFGFVAVMGTLMLQSNQLDTLFSSQAISASLAIGLSSVAVLNLNNMRDIISDARNGKRTVAVFLGIEKALIYQSLLLVFAFVAWVLLSVELLSGVALWLMCLCSFAIMAWHVYRSLVNGQELHFTRALQNLSRHILFQVFLLACLSLL